MGIKRRHTMFWSKILSTTAVITFFLGIATIDNGVAGEKQKVKSHETYYTTTAHHIDVGDEEGHMLAIYELRGVSFDEITGERRVNRGVGFSDSNPNKPEENFGRGYVVSTDKDGDKLIMLYEGNTWTIIDGTGKYAGAKGDGTVTSYSLAPNQGAAELEGDMEIP